MENENGQEGDIGMNNDEEDSDIEEEYPRQQIVLNEYTFQRLKQIDPTITDIDVELNTDYNGDKSFFHKIDWVKDGDCIADNNQLRRVHISYDVSGTDYMLGEEGQNLPTKHQLQDFFSCIYRSRSIKVLGFSNIDIDINDEFGGSLIEGLGGHPSLENLEYSLGILGSIGIEALGKVLRHPESKLKYLLLSSCQVDDEELSIVCDSLLGNIRMRRLCLTGRTNITLTGWQVFSNFLQNPNCNLIQLTLDSTGINDESANLLGTALCGSSVKNLNLSVKSISKIGWQTFLNQLSQSSLKRLYLGDDNDIDDNSLPALANIRTLKALVLGWVKSITPIGWRSLFNSLQSRGSQLVKLDISYSKVGNEGITALGRLLSNTNTLKTLDMGSMSYQPNNITSQGWQTFFTTLQDSNLSLVKLFLCNNNIGDDVMPSLTRAVSNMNLLKCLNLSGNDLVSPTGWLALSDYLQSPNFALEELDLNYNNINDNMVAAFSSALANNKTLQRLCLEEEDSNEDDDEDEYEYITRGWSAITTLLCNKSSIMNTYNSNHTLCDVNTLSDFRPDDLESYLKLNKNEDKVEVARQKILQTHFSSEDDATSNIQELLDMELEVMPTAIAWIGRPTPINWTGTSVSGLSLLYNLTKRVPDLFDSNTQNEKQCAGKRKHVA